MRTLRALRALFLLAVVAALGACSTVSQRTMTFSEADLARMLEQHGPFQRRLLEVLDVRVQRPTVRLLTSSNRLASTFEVAHAIVTHGMEATAVDPIPESLGTRQPTEESSAPAGGLGDSERLAPTADRSAAVPGATVEAAKSSGAEARVVALESRAEKLAMPEEQTACPKTSKGVVGHAV